MAWSKIGCIAYITPDGRGVHLSNLRCNSKDGIWEHTEGVPIDHVSTIYNGRELAHISWNSSGLELAVVDVFGRLSLFSIFIALNRIAVSRSCIVEPEDNLSALVGLMWLNTDRMVRLLNDRCRRSVAKYLRSSYTAQRRMLKANGTILQLNIKQCLLTTLAASLQCLPLRVVVL